MKAMLSNYIKKIFNQPEKMQLWAFAFFCVFLPFQFALNPAEGIDLAVVRVIIPILFLVSIFIYRKNKDFFHVSPLEILIFTLAFFAIFSLSYSSNLTWSLRKLLFLVSIVPVYFVSAIAMQSKESQRLILKSLVFGAASISLLALIQFFSQFVFGINAVYDFFAKNIMPFFLGNSFADAVLTYPSWLVSSQGTNYMRAIAVFPDPHMLSYYLGILIPWSLALGATSKKNSVWFYLIATLLFVADIATFTRGGYIALIAGSITAIPLVSGKTRIKIIFAIALIFSLFTLAPHSPVAGRLTSSFDVQEGSNQGRLSNWQQALLIIKNNPQGVGIGMYPLAVNPGANYREPIYAHNSYLDIAAELGVLASVIFIIIILLAIHSFWKASKSEPFFVAGVSSLIIFSVHSLVETPLYSVHVFPVFLIILALSVVAKKYVSFKSN